MAASEADAAGLEIIEISTDTEEKYAPETAPLVIDAPIEDDGSTSAASARAAAVAMRAAVAERLVYYTSYPIVPPRSVVDHLDSFGIDGGSIITAFDRIKEYNPYADRYSMDPTSELRRITMGPDGARRKLTKDMLRQLRSRGEFEIPSEAHPGKAYTFAINRMLQAGVATIGDVIKDTAAYSAVTLTSHIPSTMSEQLHQGLLGLVDSFTALQDIVWGASAHSRKWSRWHVERVLHLYRVMDSVDGAGMGVGVDTATEAGADDTDDVAGAKAGASTAGRYATPADAAAGRTLSFAAGAGGAPSAPGKEGKSGGGGRDGDDDADDHPPEDDEELGGIGGGSLAAALWRCANKACKHVNAPFSPRCVACGWELDVTAARACVYNMAASMPAPGAAGGAAPASASASAAGSAAGYVPVDARLFGERVMRLVTKLLRQAASQAGNAWTRDEPRVQADAMRDIVTAHRAAHPEAAARAAAGAGGGEGASSAAGGSGGDGDGDGDGDEPPALSAVAAYWEALDSADRARLRDAVLARCDMEQQRRLEAAVMTQPAFAVDGSGALPGLGVTLVNFGRAARECARAHNYVHASRARARTEAERDIRRRHSLRARDSSWVRDQVDARMAAWDAAHQYSHMERAASALEERVRSGEFDDSNLAYIAEVGALPASVTAAARAGFGRDSRGAAEGKAGEAGAEAEAEAEASAAAVAARSRHPLLAVVRMLRRAQHFDERVAPRLRAALEAVTVPGGAIKFSRLIWRPSQWHVTRNVTWHTRLGDVAAAEAAAVAADAAMAAAIAAEEKDGRGAATGSGDVAVDVGARGARGDSDAAPFMAGAGKKPLLGGGSEVTAYGTTKPAGGGAGSAAPPAEVTRRVRYQLGDQHDTVTVPTSFTGWRLAALLTSMWVYASNLIFAAIVSLWVGPLSIRTLFLCDRFTPHRKVDPETGALVRDESRTVNTLCYLVRSLWEDIASERRKFEARPDASLLGKGCERVFFCLWHYLILGCCGSLCLIVGMTLLVLLSTALSIFVMTTGVGLGPIAAVVAYVWNVAIYDWRDPYRHALDDWVNGDSIYGFSSDNNPYYADYRDGPRWRRGRYHPACLPLVNVVLFGFVWNALRIVGVLLYGLVLRPAFELLKVVLVLAVSLVRYIWDTLMFYCVLRPRARMPYMTSCVAVRTGGPDLDLHTYKQKFTMVPAAVALLVLHVKLELDELGKWSARHRAAIERPMADYHEFMVRVMGMFAGTAPDSGSQWTAPEALRDTTQGLRDELERVFAKRNKQLQRIHSMARAKRSQLRQTKVESDATLRLAAALMSHFCPARLLARMPDDEARARFWRDRDLTVGDWRGAAEAELRELFTDDFVRKPLSGDASDVETVTMAVEHMSFESYVGMLAEPEGGGGAAGAYEGSGRRGRRMDDLDIVKLPALLASAGAAGSDHARGEDDLDSMGDGDGDDGGYGRRTGIAHVMLTVADMLPVQTVHIGLAGPSSGVDPALRDWVGTQLGFGNLRGMSDLSTLGALEYGWTYLPGDMPVNRAGERAVTDVAEAIVAARGGRRSAETADAVVPPYARAARRLLRRRMRLEDELVRRHAGDAAVAKQLRGRSLPSGFTLDKLHAANLTHAEWRKEVAEREGAAAALAAAGDSDSDGERGTLGGALAARRRVEAARRRRDRAKAEVLVASTSTDLRQSQAARMPVEEPSRELWTTRGVSTDTVGSGFQGWWASDAVTSGSS